MAAGLALGLLGAVAPAAAAPAPSTLAMLLGARTAVPQGYLNFCRRQPADCGPDAAAVLNQVAQAQAEAPDQTADARPAASSISAGAAYVVTAIPRMGPGLWAKLNRVNEVVNRTLTSQSDAANYGVEDYWATPLEAGTRTGDCEDYVLEKQRALLAAGVPREALSIAIVRTAQGETHAVLLVKTQDEELVLDNRSAAIAPWWATAYRWETRQRPGQPMTWVTVANP